MKSISTYLDELVEFPRIVLDTIASNELIRDLLADKRHATVEDIEDNNGDYKWLYEYDYVDDTTQDTACYICLDVVVPRVSSSHILAAYVVVNVISHKNYMRIDTKKFPQIRGNRRDNIVRLIDKELNGSKKFGIGHLELKKIESLSVPQNYTGKSLVYEICDFNRVSTDG